MRLTAKEKKALPLLKKRMSDKEIAKKLKMKVKEMGNIKMSIVNKILSEGQDK